LKTTPTSETIVWPDPQRKLAFQAWLQAVADSHGIDSATLRSASSDASFRRYLRVDTKGSGSLIVMDAPPPQEDVRPFVAIAALLHDAGLNAPRVLEQQVDEGFLLLTDLGSNLYLGALQDAVARSDTQMRDSLMRDATKALIRLQTHGDASSLPPYDDALLRRELALFPDWCVTLECGATWTADEHQQWREVCDMLVGSALAQPVVAVHRDYMPRNLMVRSGEPDQGANPGILDFQDAVRGPVTYDVASLLRDAFISWEEDQEIDWAVRYWEAARKAGVALNDDFGEFWRQLEWMGLQRHLKVLGIFCRLKHRDAKPKYSQDLPRFFNYAHKVAARYNALRPFARMLEPLMGAQRIETYY